VTSATRDSPQRPSAIRTFLIADIRGYTRFTQQVGDEAASRLAAKFARLMAEGVEAWGGTLIELRGDEALCVFDSARQAFRAAVELQDAFADETLAEPHLPLTVGIGLDAGEAVPVSDGFRGAALNLAARLCASAAAGEVRATDSLVHLAGRVNGLKYDALEPAHFKGIDEPVTAVLIRSADDARQAAPASDPRRAGPPPLPAELDSYVPFAGRSRDLLWLGWHWRRARSGHRRTVVISGPTGIGKTRLAAELAALAHRDGGSVVYLGGAQTTPETFERMSPSSSPTMVVIDDLDDAPAAAVNVVGAGSPALFGDSTLTLVAHRNAATSAVLGAIERLDAADERLLGGLDHDGVRAIAALYAEESVDELPIQLIKEESDGVPAAVHRLASQWARNQATRRLGASAERTASGRRGLRAAEEALIGDVADLERATERTRLFVTVEDAPDDRSGVVCPYKGLAAFESSDADYFFGRDRVVAELIARLVGSPFVALVGASGSGKSSVLRAGLLPALERGVLPGSGAWIQVLLRPGSHPMDELAKALAGAQPAPDSPAGAVEGLAAALGALAPGQRLLLVVDQFEELFTSMTDEHERHAFVDLLTQPRTGLKVIVAMRADHYGHGAAYPALARLLGADQVLVGPLTSSELASVVEHPAHSVGLRVEPALTDALVTDAGAEPGALPLLSTALLELWLARDGNRLTLAAYRARGGLRGAVARLAESAYLRLAPAEQAVARSIMLRLAGPGEGETLVRRRVSIEEFDTDQDTMVAEVLDALTAQRLLTTGDGYVEVAHEALLREWPRLRSWLDEDAAGRRLRLHLIGAARDWVERGRETGDLYRGARLAAMLDWAAEHDPELNATERSFLDESRASSEADMERQRRTNRRLRMLLAGAGVFLVAAVIAGGVALVQGQQAEAEAARADAAAEEATVERQAAEEAEALARSRELAASAISYLDDDPSLSKLLALSAAAIADPPIETVAALHQAWAADRIIHRYEWPAEQVVNDLGATLDPTGRLIAAAGDSHYLEVVEWESSEVVWSYDPGTDDAWISQPYFTSDGEFIVASVLYAPEDPASSPDPPKGLVGLHFWRSDTGELVRTLDIGRCGSFLVTMSDTHAVVAAEVDEGPCTEFDTPALDLIDLESGKRTRLTPNSDYGWGVALSADGHYVAFEDFSGTEGVSYVVDTATGDPVLTIDTFDLGRGQQDSITRALNTDGSLLLYGDRPAQVWDVAAREVIASFGGHAGESQWAAFSSDGESVYSTGRDSTLRHWDARTGEEFERFPGIGSGRVALTDSGLALVGRQDSTAVLVDLRPRGEVTAIATCRGFVPADQLTAANGVAAFAVSGCEGDPATGSSLVVDLEAGELVVSEAGAIGQDQTLSPDGSRFARQEGSYPMYGPVTVRDARTGGILVELEGLCTWDDQLIGEAEDAQPGCNQVPDPPFRFFAQELRWSGDGTRVVGLNGAKACTAASLCGGAGGGFMVWDAASGRLLLADATAASSSILSPDASEVIIATDDDRVAPEGGLHLVRYSVATGEVVANVALDEVEGANFAGFSTDGSVLYLINSPSGLEGGALRAVDAATFEVIRSRERVSDGSVKASALSPDGSLIATGSSDGFVRVWDAETFALVHEMFIGDTQVQGVAFTTDAHLAITPEDGGIFVHTIDTDELLSIVRSSLDRGLTDAECERFNFGDACPTLAELRGED